LTEGGVVWDRNPSFRTRTDALAFGSSNLTPVMPARILKLSRTLIRRQR
jgi:hypothetical protein